MPAYSVFRFKNHALLAALAAAYPAMSYSAGAASVDFSTGNVMAVSAAGACALIVPRVLSIAMMSRWN